MDFSPQVNSIKAITDVFVTDELPRLSAAVQEVELAANKEKDVITSMSEISFRYSELAVEIEKQDSARFAVVKSFEKLFSIIDSDVLAIRTLQSSPGMEKFMSAFKEIESKLDIVDSVLRQWQAIQHLMVNVHKFFESEEVRFQLSNELRRFKLIEAAYKSIISNAIKCETLSALIELAPDLPVSLGEMLQGLKNVIADVQGWLDNKRLAFPRLFFVSDEELLELVSVAKKPAIVKSHLSKYVFGDT